MEEINRTAQRERYRKFITSLLNRLQSHGKKVKTTDNDWEKITFYTGGGWFHGETILLEIDKITNDITLYDSQLYDTVKECIQRYEKDSGVVITFIMDAK